MTSLRETAKSLAGHGMAALNPQCRFDRSIFILAHMRCGSTALSNVLCSRPDVSGYGEAHVRYLGRDSLGRLVVNQALRGGWKPRAAWLFDKILHNRHDQAVPDGFFTARAIFVLREPAESARSVRKLFESGDRKEYRTDAEALTYYCERVERLIQLWSGFPASRRIGIRHAELIMDPDAVLARLSQKLALTPPLENRYASNPASRKGGGGDPTVSGTLDRIVARPPEPGRTPPRLDVPEALMARAQTACDQLTALFSNQ